MGVPPNLQLSLGLTAHIMNYLIDLSVLPVLQGHVCKQEAYGFPEYIVI